MATMPIFVFTNSGISSQGMMLPYGIFLVDAVTPLDVETLGFHQTSDGGLQTVTVRTIEDVSKLPALSSVPDKLDMWPVSFGDMRSTERHTIGCYPAPPPPGVFPIGFLTQVVTGATSIMMVGISKANMSTAFLAPAASAPNPASVPAVAPAPAVAAASGGVAVVPPVASMSKKGQSMLSGARFPTVIAVGDDRADTLIRPHTVRNPRAVPELLAEFVSHELPGEYEFTRAKGKLTIVRVTQVEGGAVHKVNITGPKQLYFDSCALLNEHGNGDKEFFKCMETRAHDYDTASAIKRANQNVPPVSGVKRALEASSSTGMTAAQLLAGVDASVVAIAPGDDGEEDAAVVDAGDEGDEEADYSLADYSYLSMFDGD